jgi:fermentation-respiration switch protein FrsA (DUF1100 family)
MHAERFEFESDGVSLVGVLRRPEGRARAAVVTTGPLTSVKEQAAGAYATSLAERGFATLAFDHGTFGESGGVPRQFENPQVKVDDIRAAVAALATDERTAGLPSVAVGVCAGGGYMAQAVAQEPTIRGFAGVAGVYADVEQTRASLGDAFDSLVKRGEAAERRFEETGEVESIPAVALDGGDVAMPLREAYEFYGTSRGAVPNYVNGFAVQSFAYSLPFDAMTAADQITVPTLVVHSERALTPDLARRFYERLSVRKDELWLDSKGQIDFYDDPSLIGPASDRIAEFFATALEPAA